MPIAIHTRARVRMPFLLTPAKRSAVCSRCGPPGLAIGPLSAIREERARGVEIGKTRFRREAIADGSQGSLGLATASQATEARRRPGLPGRGSWPARQRDRVPEARLGLAGAIGAAVSVAALRPEQVPTQPVQLCLVAALAGTLHVRERIGDVRQPFARPACGP